MQFSQGAVPTAPFNFANWGALEPNNFENEDGAVFNLGPIAAGTDTGEWGDTDVDNLFSAYRNNDLITSHRDYGRIPAARANSLRGRPREVYGRLSRVSRHRRRNSGCVGLCLPA